MLLADLDNALNKVPNAGKYYKNPSEKTVFINLVQLQYFKELAGPVRVRATGSNLTPQNFQETSLENSLLSMFYKTGLVTTSVVTNIDTTVWDCNTVLDVNREFYDIKLENARYAAKESQIKILPDNKIGPRLKSTLVPPTQDVPIGSYYPNFQIAVYPTPLSVPIKYLQTPAPCEIVYTAGAFDPALSTDLEWGYDALTPLLTRALQYMGINVGNGNIFGEAAQLTTRTV
jgi:hypothetical protein